MNLIDYIKSRAIALLLCSTIFMLSCSAPQPVRHTLQGMGLGTTYSIVYINDKEVVSRAEIDSLLAQFSKSASIFDSTSLLSRINRNITDSLDTTIKECIEIATLVSQQSDGMYDITVKPLVEAYGFGSKEGGATPNIDSIMEFVGYDKIKVLENRLIKSNGVQLDLNSVAKGYCVDMVSRFLESRSLNNYLVEIGGEIFAQGVKERGEKWSIGVDKPIDGNYTPGEQLQTIIELSGRGLASSGNYRRYYISSNGERINHTLNPKTGHSVVSTLLSATVIAQTCALADAYATALMSLGSEKAIQFLKDNPTLSAYLVYSKNGQFATYQQ